MNKGGRGWRQQPLDVKAYSGKQRDNAAKKTSEQIAAEVAAYLESGKEIRRDK